MFYTLYKPPVLEKVLAPLHIESLLRVIRDPEPRYSTGNPEKYEYWNIKVLEIDKRFLERTYRFNITYL